MGEGHNIRIKRIKIDEYSPLKENTDLQFKKGVNLFYCPNDSGKSFLAEALHRKCSGKKKIPGVPKEREERVLEGFISLSHNNSKTVLKKECFKDWYNKNHEEEISSEKIGNIFFINNSDLTMTGEEEFLGRVTDELTGSRIEEIRQIKKELISQGRLTSRRLNISNDEDFKYAEDKLSEAKDLKSEIEDYLKKCREEGIDEIETKVLEDRSRVERLNRRIDRLNKAEAKENYQKVSAGVRELESLNPSEIPIETVREIENEIKGLRSEGEIERYRKEKENHAKWLMGPSIGAVLAVIGTLINTIFVWAAIPLSLFGVFLYIQWSNKRDKISDYESDVGKIHEKAREVGIEAQEIDELRKKAKGQDKKYSNLKKKQNGLIGSLGSRIDIDSEKKEQVLEEAREWLEENEENKNFEVDIDFDESKLKELKEKKGRIEEEISSNEGELEDHRRKILGMLKRARKLNFEYFTGKPLGIEEENLASLERLKKRLKDLINKIKTDKELSIKAIEIFKEIERSEEEKTSDLFKEGHATEIFREVTDGKYKSINYDKDNNTIEVELESGKTLSPMELGKGARGQLYLSIRIYLAEKILGSKAFFVMDDAFLASSPDRLERQAEVIKDLANQGWQIIYLTAKREDANIIKEVTGSKLRSFDILS